MTVKTIKRGGVYLVDLGHNGKGSIQQGKRPCLVVSNDYTCVFSNAITVIPTSSKRTGELYNTQLHLTPNESNRLNRPTTALCEQITTVHKSQLQFKIGDLTPEELEDLMVCLSFSLGLN